MSLPPQDDHIGKALDRALDQMDIRWDRSWKPELAKRRASSWWVWSGASTVAAAAAAVALFVPWAPPLVHQQVVVSVPVAAPPSLPRSVTRVLKQFRATDVSVTDMVPVFSSYPLVNSTARSYSLTGNFTYAQVAGNQLTLVVNNGNQVTSGVLFANQSPVYSVRLNPGLSNPNGLALASSQVMATTPSPELLGGQWYQAGSSQISSFTASGPIVYATHEGYWTAISGQGNGQWKNPPVGNPSRETATIAGLPADPNHALLVEEDSSGMSRGYITTNQGQSWRPWSLPPVTFSNLVSMNHRYWAIVNGSLEESAGGSSWTPILSLNPNRWQVQDYAINPSQPNMLVASLVPIAGNGIGPVLVTKNNGHSWQEIPNFPSLGVAPTDMSVLPNGDISALVTLAKPVLVQYHHASNTWQIIPVPRQAVGVGTGQLTASPNGNLVYGAPGGDIYVWNQATARWEVVDAPGNAPLNATPANPLQAIGDQQIMAAYQSGWYYYVFNAIPN